MREWLSRAAAWVRSVLGRMSPQAKILILGTAGALAAAVAVWLGFFYDGPRYVRVWEALEPAEVAEMIEVLDEQNISFKISAEGDAILVRETEADRARISLAGKGLPKRGTVGFEILAEPKFGATDFERKTNFIRALQGELERTISQVRGIDYVRVHVVLPEKSLFTSMAKPASVAVFLKNSPGKDLEVEQVMGIMHLVCRSVEGVEPENVTIIDANGRILSTEAQARLKALAGGDGSLSGGADLELAAMLKLKNDYQSALERGLISMLEPVFGPGNVVVKVSADLDFDRHAVERDVVQPQDEDTLVSSQEVEETYSGTGIPQLLGGEERGIPGYQAADRVEGTADYSRREVTRNYEVGRTTEKTLVAPGSVKRLTVGVVVNRTLEPAMANSVRNIVAAAIGVDPSRQDLISIEGVPFDTTLTESLLREMDARGPSRLPIHPAFWLAAALLALAAWAFARRRRGSEPAIAPSGQALEQERLATAAADPFAVLGRRSDLADVLEGWAREKPQLVARAIKRWLSD